MPEYIVNENAQRQSGDHEVHIYPKPKHIKCSNYPSPENQRPLGVHGNCHDAVDEAREEFGSKVNGCKNCCPDCNTG